MAGNEFICDPAHYSFLFRGSPIVNATLLRLYFKSEEYDMEHAPERERGEQERDESSVPSMSDPNTQSLRKPHSAPSAPTTFVAW